MNEKLYPAAASAARARKAIALIDALSRAGCTDAVTASDLSDDAWRLAAKVAGVREPSAETKLLVIDTIRRQESARTKDPFDGL